MQAFRKPPLVEEQTRKKATIVFAHDWGNDGAEANVVHQIRTIGQVFNTDLEVTTVLGIPPLGSPLIAAIEFDRVIDTHKITLELCARKLEARGLKKDQVEKQLSNLILINIFDRGVGSDRVAAIVKGQLKIKGDKIRENVIMAMNRDMVQDKKFDTSLSAECLPCFWRVLMNAGMRDELTEDAKIDVKNNGKM